MTHHRFSALLLLALTGLAALPPASAAAPGWEYRLKNPGLVATTVAAPAAGDPAPPAAPAAPAVVPPALSVSAATLDFGTVNDGASASRDLVITNTGGPSTLVIPAPAAPFAIAQSTCAGTLAANASCTVTLSFSPTAAVASSAVLQVSDGAAQVYASVGLSGRGAAASYDIDVRATATATVYFTIPAGVTSAKLVGGWTGSGTTTKNLQQGVNTYTVGSCYCGGSSGDLVYLDPYLKGTQGNGGRTFRFYLTGVGTFTSVRLQYQY